MKLTTKLDPINITDGPISTFPHSIGGHYPVDIVENKFQPGLDKRTMEQSYPSTDKESYHTVSSNDQPHPLIPVQIKPGNQESNVKYERWEGQYESYARTKKYHIPHPTRSIGITTEASPISVLKQEETTNILDMDLIGDEMKADNMSVKDTKYSFDLRFKIQLWVLQKNF